jgi:hypothetical protein
MDSLSYTLVADGSAERALLPVLDWLLREVFPHLTFTGQFADTRGLRKPSNSLADRLSVALALYPCDLLFVHRDAENQPPDRRYAEIQEALATLSGAPCAVRIVPIRMTEAWLMFDEAALRYAAGKPHGRRPLDLVPLARVESHPDPKKHLHEQLTKASERKGRRREEFEAKLPQTVYRLASLIEDFSPLRQLVAFQRLEDDLRRLTFEQG